jgi:hypothetical protein
MVPAKRLLQQQPLYGASTPDTGAIHPISLMAACLHLPAEEAVVGQGFMQPISFKRHRFPADTIRHAVWLYFRFSLSFR